MSFPSLKQFLIYLMHDHGNLRDIFFGFRQVRANIISTLGYKPNPWVPIIFNRFSFLLSGVFWQTSRCFIWGWNSGCVPFGESKNGFLILDLPDFSVERNVKSEIGFVTLVTFRQLVQYARQPLKKWRVSRFQVTGMIDFGIFSARKIWQVFFWGGLI